MAPPSEELFESWVKDLGSPESEEEAHWEENFIKLVPRDHLNVKILEVGDFPRVMTDIKDNDGNVLVRKYDQLNKQVWQRLRGRSDAPEIYLICEKPIRVVENFNLEFFNYEDYQYLGAYLAEKGKLKSANTLFTDALKSETADAYINKGIFHYRSGATGVFDNYRLAKKHFEKGLERLYKMKFLPVDERRRRKICEEAVYEIDFKTSGGFFKFFKSIIRILTLHFEKDIFYVGVADRKNMQHTETLRLMVDTIAKYELQMMRESTENFIYALKLEIPGGSEDLILTLDGLANQVRAARAEAEIAQYLSTLGDIHARATRATERKQKVEEEAKREASVSLLDRLSVDENAQIKRLDAVYSLKSPRELADLAERKDIDRMITLWLYRERSHIKMIMEVLYQNPAVSGDLKAEIEKRFGFGARATPL